MSTPAPKLGIALSGGGHRAAFFHIGVLAKLAELGLLRRIEVISTVSGGSIVGALFYLHTKNLLEDKTDTEITDADYVQLVRAVEEEYRAGAATNVRGSTWVNPLSNFKMAKPTYSRTDRVGELYERRFYAGAWRNRIRRAGRIAMRDLLIQPKGHDGPFDPDRNNAMRNARVPILLLEATTLNTGHNWRFEAMYMGEPPRQGTEEESERADVDKNAILERTRWEALPAACRDFPLGGAVAASACFPGGFPPVQVPGLFEDYVVELIDGGVHDNQGIEGLYDRSCTHTIISDGSGQMSDRARPSTRLPAVLGRVVSIYGDAEREQRLLAALSHSDSVAFMHLQTGLPAKTRAPGGKTATTDAALETAEFGVDLEVQRALANVRTDLDAFCEVEAWSLMADGYQLAGRIVPSRPSIAELASPATETGWVFDVVRENLARPLGDAGYLKTLHVAKERFLKPARVVSGGVAAATALLVLAAAVAVGGLWVGLVPHGMALFIALVVIVACLVLYFVSERAYAKPVATLVFDVALPALLAIPLVAVAGLQLATGRLWLRAGAAERLKTRVAAVPVKHL
jgi:NTE family protein